MDAIDMRTDSREKQAGDRRKEMCVQRHVSIFLAHAAFNKCEHFAFFQSF